MRRKLSAISREDWKRLRRAAGRPVVDLDCSLLGPRSITWAVSREAVLLAGGGCALLLQVAHPLIAAGVAAHSNFRERPLDRLYRTLDLMLTITFGSAREAIAAVREIERRHARVRGTLPAAAGSFPKDTPYDANDPHLMLWVHATLVDTAVRVFEMCVRPLSEDERDRYYEESKVVARILGVPDRVVPATRRQFERYCRDMLTSAELAVSEQSREIAEAVLAPSTPLWLRALMPPVRVLTLGLLPEVVRQRYGFDWPAWQKHAFRTLVLSAQIALPWVPARLRYFPQAQAAWIRETAIGELPGRPRRRAAVGG